MRSVRNVLLCSAVIVLTLPVLTLSSSATVDAAAAMNGFGGAVLVGNGEIFAGEAANLFRPGTVYIYRKDAGAWQQAQALHGPDAAVGDRFGSSLAFAGSRLFVGAGTGSVHVFMKEADTWSHAGTISTDAVEGDDVQFGAIDAGGDWLLVGQQVAGGGRGRRGGGFGGRGRGSDAPPPPAGRVYAFRADGSGQYTHASTITSPDDESAGDGFGAAIAMAGDVALIGANGQAGRAGVVHEFTIEGGDWSRARSFAPTGVQSNEAFGSAIALAGNQAVVTAPGDAGGYGAVYMFRRVEQAGRRGGGGGQAGRGGGAPQDNMTWREDGRLAVPAGVRQDQFGTSVAFDDLQIWVGSPGLNGTGGVMVFGRADADERITSINMLAAGLAPGAASGQSVSLRGNVAAVGATGLNGRAGGLLIFERGSDGQWAPQLLVTAALDEIPPLTGDERPCTGQGIVEMFECANTALMAFLPPSKLTHDGHYIEMSDIWGWTDPETGTEWALLGRRDGSTFLDMSDPTNPIAVADLPLTDGARPASWRDIKVYRDHAYIVADGAGQHGMQVFDLTRLRDMEPQPDGRPTLVEYDALYDGIASAHNIVINEESGFAYSVGSSGGGETCGGGLHMIDIRDVTNPTFAGCFADEGTGRRGTGYSHDAQCVTYHGPDSRYTDHEICVGSNETTMSIADVTDKENPRGIGRATYPNVAYAHQGWFTDDHAYFFMDDEADEGGGIPQTRTMIFDVKDLENPVLLKEHMGVAKTSDHNLYIKGDYMYQANYRSGLRILNIADPENPVEVAFFDTAPYMGDSAGYNGAWSVYPFFDSGVIIVSSIEQGIFFVRPTDRPIRR